MFFQAGTILITIVLSLLSFSIHNTFAGSYPHGAKGAGMGTAFSSISDNPSAIAHNPAGIGFQKGTRLYGGTIVLLPKTEFKDAAGNNEETESEAFSAPHLFLTSEISDTDFTLGLGIFSPFGVGGRSWSENGSTRYISTSSLISTLAASPVVAWRPQPTLSLAFGPILMYANESMERMVNQSAVNGTDAKTSFEADGTGWGWNVSLLWKPSKKVHFGAVYRSRVKLDVEGDIELTNIAPALQSLFGGQAVSTGASSSHDFPAVATLSISWLPDDHWTFAVEGEWVQWSTFDNQTISIDNPASARGLTGTTIIMDWEDSWIFKIGGQYKLNDTWAFRGGYSFTTSQVPSETMNPATPEGDQHYFSAGVGLSFTKLTVDFYYSYTLHEDRTVSNAVTNGEYSNNSHSLGVSIGWKF